MEKYKPSVAVDKAIREGKELIQKPVVLIQCITYNQEKYIGKCLDGFLMQETNFPFVALIHDDASSDGTADIIMEYAKIHPDIIKPVCDNVNRHNERTLGRVLDDIIDAYDPKYIAICEGDDFWTSPMKLQMQVDYLSEHPECVMCHTDYTDTTANKHKTLKHYDDEPYFGPGHIHNYNICSLTAVYRKEAYDKCPQYRYSHKWLMGDKPKWIELSHEGKFHFIDKITGTYRVLSNSASHSTDVNKMIAFWECKNEITEFYSKLYGYPYTLQPKSALYDQILEQSYYNKDQCMSKTYWRKAKQEHQTTFRMFLFYVANHKMLRWIIPLAYRFV